MKKTMKWLVRIVCILTGLAGLLLVGGFFLLNTSWLQQKLKDKALTMLTEKLDTEVALDSVSIDLLTMDAKLYGLSVEDRQQRPLLKMAFLQADVDLWQLLQDEVRIREAKVTGLRAELHKVRKDSLSPDTVANYQFIVDAFKSDKKVNDSIAVKKKRKKMSLIMRKVKIDHVKVVYNEDSVQLDRLLFAQNRKGIPRARVEGLRGSWERVNKKGETVTNQALVSELELRQEDGMHQIKLKRVNFKTNNHRPRKNSGKPKRGFFDVGHFNIWADMKLVVDKIEDGTVHGWLREMTARDTITGIDIRRLQCEVTANKDGMRLEDVQIQQGEGTVLRFVRGDMHFPKKKEGKQLKYFTSTISGKALLKDISRPFAPVLSNFTLPLDLSVRMEGDGDGMRFRDVVVSRPKGALTINATGYITGLKDKYALKVHFDVSQMKARQGEPERIINQFSVKKFMMKQLNALGDIRYTGSFNVLWKKEEFMGILYTKAGDLKFYFALDENNKYVFGNANAQDIKLGQVMDIPKLGPVAAEAIFKFDISKPRTALMRKRLGGKLPIGDVKAKVGKASYGALSVSDVDVKIISDGAVAEGEIRTTGKLADISCDFSFTNTNEMQKMKVKPHLKFHLFGRSKDEKEELELKKQQKAREASDEKAAKKAAAAEAKAAKKAEKDARKAAKAAEKAERKAAKAAEKEARRAEKAAAKAARKAAKAAEDEVLYE